MGELPPFRAPLWLPGGNLQTIWPALFSRHAPRPPPAYRRERWSTPDGDFVDVDFADAPDPAAPRRRVVLAVDLDGPAPARAGGLPSAVAPPAVIPWARVVSLHVDEPEAEADVAAAAESKDGR